MNEQIQFRCILFNCVAFLLLSAGIFSGCATKPVVIDAGDTERVRFEYQQLRGEYEKLESDYKRLAEDSQWYVDYYRNATAAIESGLGELASIGADSAGEIQKLRILISILRNIVQSLIDAESEERKRNIAVKGQADYPR